MISSGKIDSSDVMNSQLRAGGRAGGRAGWKPTRYVGLFSAHFEELCFKVDIFSSTNGSRSFKTSATENFKD